MPQEEQLRLYQLMEKLNWFFIRTKQDFIPDLSFNPEITDELMVIYFDLNNEIFCITHES